MKKTIGILAVLIAGTVIGSLITFIVLPELSTRFDLFTAPKAAAETKGKKEPLYWVAPMDANYRRDKPGKSPMGMDLVPVYEEDDEASDVGPGAVKISPDVVNNLGVRTATAKSERLHPMIRTVGYVDYDEDKVVHIHPRVKGWIEKLYVQSSGDPVKKGQPLYAIYSPELVNAQEELLLALDRKSARLISAAEQRLRSLRVPEEVITSLKKNGKVRQDVIFYSPQRGVVDNLSIREGFYVNPGVTIMSIGSLDQVWVEAEVFERQASLVAAGQFVTMTLDYLPGKKWQGSVDYIYPTLDPKTRTVRVRLRFDNGEGLLKPNMFAQVVIQLESSEQTLLVPKEAVIRSGGSNRVVLALGEGRFKSVDVDVGRYDERFAEILSGISAGEKVVTSAQFLIDSESSKTSDFKRIHHGEAELPQSVWTEATINALMPEKRSINATHREISQWDWSGMTMDFKAADSIDFGALEEGMHLQIEITRTAENQYLITSVHNPAEEDKRSLDDLSLDNMNLDDMALE